MISKLEACRITRALLQKAKNNGGIYTERLSTHQMISINIRLVDLDLKISTSTYRARIGKWKSEIGAIELMLKPAFTL